MQLTPEIIEKNWPLTNVVLKPMPKRGMVGIVGIIQSAEGIYVYKTAGHWKSAKNLDRDLSVYDFLNEKGFPYISELLKTKSGERFITLEDKLLYLMKYVEGNHPESTPEVYAELGKITGELHSIPDFPFESDYKVKDAIPQLIEKIQDQPFKEEYISLLKSLPDLTGLTMVLMHTEMTPGNVIQTPSGKIIPIDWDESGGGPAVLDIGVHLINHFITEDLEILEANAKAYYQSYFSLRTMSEEEKKFIFDTAVFWACAWVFYGDIEKRWKKIKWAVENREMVIERCLR